jgi:hypothetical protein
MVSEEIQHKHAWKQIPRTPRGYVMDAYCEDKDGVCEEIKKDIFPATTFEGFIRRWVAGELKNQTLLAGGRYRATKRELFYYGRNRSGQVGKDVLAIRLPDSRVIGNASKLSRCGSYRRGMEAPAQRVMQQMEMPLIPFNVFQEVKLDLFEAEIIVQGKPEELMLPKMVWNNRRAELEAVDIWEYKSQYKKPNLKGKTIKDFHAKKSPVYKGNGKYIKKNRMEYSWEELTPSNMEDRHFIGAMILKIKHKPKDLYYLFDVDRRELGFYRFNAFLSQLPRGCKTIEEAYQMLKPKQVVEAEKQGLKVLRQGEWFFIPCEPRKVKASERDKKVVKDKPSPAKYDLDGRYYDRDKLNEKADLSMIKKYRKAHIQRIKDFNKFVDKYQRAERNVQREHPNDYATYGELRADQNRPNTVEKYIRLPDGEFVNGRIQHSGREHELLELKKWHKPVPNTAIASFTIVGNID